MGWKKRALTKSLGKEIKLETMDNEYWIIPKKLSWTAMQEMGEINKIDLEDEEVAGKSIEEIEKAVARKLKGKKGKALYDKDTEKMFKIALLSGVHDHNFDDEEGNKLKWDEELFNQLKDFMDTMIEIFKVVMEFNRPLAHKKSGK